MEKDILKVIYYLKKKAPMVRDSELTVYYIN